MARRPWLWLGIGCYVLEFVLWLAFISLVPLSDGVLLGSISIVVVMLLGRVFFRERLTPCGCWASCWCRWAWASWD